MFTHIKTLIFVILIKFLFCYKSSICSSILKLSTFKYSSVTKVQFVHQYQNPQFCNFDQISILLQKFILFTQIEACNFQIFVWFIHLLHKFNLHPYQNSHFCNIDQIFILLQKFILFTHIEAFNLQIFICYKSSICSPMSKS